VAITCGFQKPIFVHICTVLIDAVVYIRHPLNGSVRHIEMELSEIIKLVLSDDYLISKICSLKKIKGIESDLRFLFERGIYSKYGIIPDSEVGNRNDMLVDFEGSKIWLEFKCYDGVLSVNDTQTKIRSDLKKLASITDASEKYFGTKRDGVEFRRFFFHLFGCDFRHVPKFISFSDRWVESYSFRGPPDSQN